MSPRKQRQTVAAKALEKYCQFALNRGASAAKIIDVRTVKTAQWVRLKCQYGCGGWASSLCCPPFTPGPEETARVLEEYRRGMLLAYHFKGPASARKTTRRRRDFLVQLERMCFLDGHYKAFGYANGPCRLCASCDTTGTCLHPERARPAMEACGIDVFATARANGIDLEVVQDLEDKYTYCNLLLID